MPWVVLFVVLFVLFVLSTGPLLSRPGAAAAIAVSFVAIQLWTIVLGRRRIAALEVELREPDLAEQQPSAISDDAPRPGALGDFRREPEMNGWVADFWDGDRRIQVVIEGDAQPDMKGMRRAQGVFSKWPAYRESIESSLKAESESYRRHGLYEEAMSLHIAQVEFSSRNNNDRYFVVHFKGRTDLREWRMELDDRAMLHFGFDRQ